MLRQLLEDGPQSRGRQVGLLAGEGRLLGREGHVHRRHSWQASGRGLPRKCRGPCPGNVATLIPGRIELNRDLAAPAGGRRGRRAHRLALQGGMQELNACQRQRTPLLRRAALAGAADKAWRWRGHNLRKLRRLRRGCPLACTAAPATKFGCVHGVQHPHGGGLRARRREREQHVLVHGRQVPQLDQPHLCTDGLGKLHIGGGRPHPLYCLREGPRENPVLPRRTAPVDAPLNLQLQRRLPVAGS
mmetsp:Transcript_103737/g.276030  ORF Transcript_103737/g.276030 Transcript_103737/m.276030 type:complete len:245 (+) Transcript_103737:526-1260(+)